MQIYWDDAEMEEGTQSRTNRRILFASVLVCIILAAGLAFLYWENLSLRRQISTLAEQNENLAEELQLLRQQFNMTQSQLEYYKRQAEYYSSLLQGEGNLTGALLGKSLVNIVAVKEVRKDFFTVSYEGVTMEAAIELRQGSGRILINTQPRIGIDLQTSARTAALVAENLTGKEIRNIDIILTIVSEMEVDVVDGPSAGAAITVAIMAAIENKTINMSIYMTGTVNPDGTIGPVGCVLEKAVAAAKNGAEKFLVPKGQSIVTLMVPEEHHPAPGITIITYRVEQINLQQYLQDAGYNTTVVEVGTIEEAYSIMVKQS